MYSQAAFKNSIKQVLGVPLSAIAGKKSIINGTEQWHVGIDNPPYQRFTMEIIGTWHDDNMQVSNSEFYLPVDVIRFAMDHWITINGDLVSDPDIIFDYVVQTGEIIPVSFQNMLVYIECTTDEERKDQLLFMAIWGKNLVDQGFGKARVVAEKKTKEEVKKDD